MSERASESNNMFIEMVGSRVWKSSVLIPLPIAVFISSYPTLSLTASKTQVGRVVSGHSRNERNYNGYIHRQKQNELS